MNGNAARYLYVINLLLVELCLWKPTNLNAHLHRRLFCMKKCPSGFATLRSYHGSLIHVQMFLLRTR